MPQQAHLRRHRRASPHHLHDRSRQRSTDNRLSGRLLRRVQCHQSDSQALLGYPVAHPQLVEVLGGRGPEGEGCAVECHRPASRVLRDRRRLRGTFLSAFGGTTLLVVSHAGVFQHLLPGSVVSGSRAQGAGGGWRPAGCRQQPAAGCVLLLRV
ncbi:unnamed protein product [Ectocarpus sp. 12 AP-2014]